MPFEAAPFGVTGLETAFAVLYTHLVGPGILPLATVLERMSAGPARVFGLERPRIAVGAAANLVAPRPRARVDGRPAGVQVAVAELLALGEQLTGQVAMTIAGGAVAFEQ